MRATPGTGPRGVSPAHVRPSAPSQRAPTCVCQGEVATSGQIGATPQAVTPGCDPNRATRENRARAAPGGRRTPLPRGPIGATPRMQGPGVQSGPPPECGGPIRATPGTGPWNVSPAHVRPSAPSQRAPTCDCQGEVATSGQVGATPRMRRPDDGHPRSVSPVRARPRAPVRERQHVIAKARSPQAARLGPHPKLREWGHP
jgi:hypothetical protein